MNRVRVSIAILLAGFAAAQANAQAPAAALSEPPAGTNMVLVIRAADLGFRTVVLEINGSKAAELKSGESYTGVYAPGKLRFTFPGDAAWQQVDTFAIANEEHVYELKFATIRRPGELFGTAQPGLVLLERKTIIAGYEPPAPPQPKAIAVTDLQGAQKQVIAKRADAGAWRELGRHYLADGDAGKAIRAYRQALRLQPGDADALEALAAIERGAGQKK